jgi:hypothetical protein
MELGNGEKNGAATASLLARGGAFSSPRPFFHLFFSSRLIVAFLVGLYILL